MQEILKKLVEFQNQLRILHWQTTSFARHKAYGDIYENFDDLLDAFIESYQGKYSKIKFDADLQIILRDYSELNLNEFLTEFITILINEIPNKLDDSDTDLFNIRDEMLALVHKLKYLLSLK